MTKYMVACVASVSSGREANPFFRPRENRASAKKKKKIGGGRRGEEKETLADKPLDFENHPLTITSELSHTDQWARGSRITSAKIVYITHL